VTEPATILVVDDTPANLKLLADLLDFKGYRVVTATDGDEGLRAVAAHRPDLVLSDIMMPRMSGYELCQRIRACPETALLPVVLVTSLDPHQERIKGIEAGADDFLAKPINTPELLARVRSLLRIKALTDQVQAQAQELAELNARLESRVAAQVGQLERLARLKRFLAPQLAELIVSSDADDPLRSHRREVTVVFLDLRGFTGFAETSEPEEVMSVLRDYHNAMGQLVQRYEGTLERFTGDGMMVFFNDPVVVPNPAERAVRMAVEMRDASLGLSQAWRRRGIDLGLGIGIAMGFATIGSIGFEGRMDYGAIGTVTNLASRLCGKAAANEILADCKTVAAVEALARVEEAGLLELHGFSRPVRATRILGLQPAG
jgi:adenylate cyclase